MSKGMKFDSDKIRMDLLPFVSLEAVAKVLTFGAKKYAPNNWKLVDNAQERYEAALLRHLTAIKKGEDVDIDSGLPHIYHVACNAMFLVYFYDKNNQ